MKLWSTASTLAPSRPDFLNSLSQELTSSYDNNGNVTAIGSLDYTWAWRNRLASER